MNTNFSFYQQAECAESLAHRKDLLAKQELSDRCQEYENDLTPRQANALIGELYELIEDYTYLVNNQSTMLKKISIAHKTLVSVTRDLSTMKRTDGALKSIINCATPHPGLNNTWED